MTLDDAKRVAKRLLDGGMLVTVVGRPKGVTSSRAANRRPRRMQLVAAFAELGSRQCLAAER